MGSGLKGAGFWRINVCKVRTSRLTAFLRGTVVLRAPRGLRFAVARALAMQIGNPKGPSFSEVSSRLSKTGACVPAHNSRTLYCNASSMCEGSIVSLPERSAMVRASFIVL